MGIARGPETFTTPIPPAPGGVATAAMVSLSITQKIPDVFLVSIRMMPCSGGQSRYERSLLLSCGLLEPNNASFVW
jgi:hypothetical protein